MIRLPHYIARTLLLSLIVLLAGGCGVYYNTFYNAKKAFNEAEGERKSSDIGQPRIRTQSYNLAIDKSLKVVENYPNSKYYDDAVFVLGVSYYWTKQYTKAERRFREILLNYPDTKFARESRLYLAQSLLQQEDIDEAMDIFESLFNSKIDRKQKTEAAIALGQYHYDNGDFKTATQYFLAVRDSLGNDDEKRIAQRRIADGLFEQWHWADALAAYLQALGLDPSTPERYHALFRSAECSYRLQRIDDGLDYLKTLADNELYFDSISVLQLKMAAGYEWDDDLDQAEELYQQVATESIKPVAQAEANYKLGLIYQFDYDNLAKAKEFYDAAVSASKSSVPGREALQLSSDIGKLETFARTITIDSTTTQDMIDEAAYAQYQLAELYWFQLNKPDTAEIEMRYVVDSFPTAYDAPKAMIALSQMALERGADSTVADSILETALGRYATTDYAGEIIAGLGMAGTAADTGYAGAFLRLAEDFLIEENIDSARAYYEVITNRFPLSKFYLQARFAQLWLTEIYESPGDSSVIFAYNEFADSFPGTEWAQVASRRTKYRPRRTGLDPSDTTEPMTEIEEQLQAEADSLGFNEDSTSYVDPERARYIDRDGGLAIDIPNNVDVMETREPFVYPTEAYTSRWEGDLYFQIQLDFSGQVIDYVQKSVAPIEEINIRAGEAVISTVFDTRLIPSDALDRWFVYKFRVLLPDHLR